MDTAKMVADGIAARIRSGERLYRSRLPSVRQLSSLWGSSPVTILAALRILVSTGMIERERFGHARYAARCRTADPRHSSEQPSSAEMSAAERIATIVTYEICTGLCAIQGKFPSMRDFQKRFHCGYNTISAALNILVQLGVIDRVGKWHRPAHGLALTKRDSAVFLAGLPDVVGMYKGHMMSLVAAAQQELGVLQWGQLKFFLHRDPMSVPAPPEHACAGYLYVAPADAEIAGRWGAYFARRPTVPVVRILPFEQTDLAVNPYVRKMWKISPDNFRAGKDVARYALSRGHRRIAFFSHVPLDDSRTVWASLRLDGIRALYTEEDTNGARSLSVLCAPERSVTSEPMRHFRNACGEVRHALTGMGLTAAAAAHALDGIEEVRNISAILAACRPSFESALADPRCVLWVCVNDQCAAAARMFLDTVSGRKGAVARHIVGFDNSALSYTVGFTSYDFGYDRVGRMAVNCLARPDAFPQSQERLIRVPGQLTVHQ